MIVKIYPSGIEGEVVSPPSKSYTHRALIAAAMGSSGKICSPLRSEDTRATVDSLKAFGADLVEYGETTEVSGVDGHIKTPDDVVNVLNSGTTLRLMMGLGSNCKGVVLTGDASLRKRPSGPLIESLRDLGAEAYSIRGGGLPPIVVKGYLKGGNTEIPGEISSQFISSLLMSCPLAEGETTIKINGELKSRPYLEITLDCLNRARIDVEHSSDYRSFRVQGGQRYALSDMTVPGDVSQAANLMAAAAVGGHIKIENLFPSKQGDFKILDILRDMGASVKWDKANGIVEVSSSGLEGVEIDASGTPDLVPIIAVLGCFAGGETTITNA